MKMKFAFALLFLLPASLPAMANTLTFTFSNANQSVAAGGTVTFNAISVTPISNTANVYINFDAINGNASPYTDDFDFLFNYAIYLAPDTIFAGDVFTVTLPQFAIPGQVFYGSYTLQGGANTNSADILDTETFSITTAGVPPAVTPEPSSLTLLVTGVIGTAGMMRKRLGSAVTRGTERAG